MKVFFIITMSMLGLSLVFLTLGVILNSMFLIGCLCVSVFFVICGGVGMIISDIKGW